MVPALIGLSATIGMFSGLFGAISKNEEEKAQLNYQKQQLENQKIDLENQYNNSMYKLNSAYDQNRNDYAISIGSTAESRDLNAISASKANVLADKQDLASLENTIISGLRTKGTLSQNIASSGFRLSSGTTQANISSQTNARIDESDSLARETYLLSSSQRFLSARYDYLNANRQIEQYQTAITRLSNSYNNNVNYLNTEYQNSLGEINDQIAMVDSEIKDRSGVMANYVTPFWEAIKGGLTFGINAAQIDL